MKMVGLTVALAATLVTAAQAATIVPISATGSSSYPGYPDADAIDQGAGAATSDWASFGQGAASTLKLDLGKVYRLSGAAVTDRVTSGGGNNGFVGGLFDFTTRYSLTAYTDATFTTTIGSPVIVDKSAPATHTSPADFLSTTAFAARAEFVKYSVLAANGANPGLSNISFSGTAVPEPAAWALMLAGFAMVGVAARRRSPHVAA